MDEHPLAWPIIESEIQDRLAHPKSGALAKIPAQTVNLFRSMIALVEVHTGLRPHRIADSFDPSLCAYYFTDREGQYAMLEVFSEYPDDDDVPTIICWGSGSETIVSVTLNDAAEGDAFRRMAAFVRDNKGD